jgi:hypothetical protein
MLMGQQLVQQLVKLLDIFSHQSGLSNMIELYNQLGMLVTPKSGVQGDTQLIPTHVPSSSLH